MYNRRLGCPLLLLFSLVTVVTWSSQPLRGQIRKLQFSSMGEAAGARQYLPGAWGVVAVDVLNPTDKQADVAAVFNPTVGDSRASIEFRRRFVVPPHARRRTWAPLRIPSRDDEDYRRRRVDVSSRLIVQEWSGEISLKREKEYKTHQTILATPPVEPVTGLLGHGAMEDLNDIEMAYEMVIALRVDSAQDRQLAFLNDREIPSVPESLDILDQLVISGNEFTDDTIGINVIRSWLHNGGRLWIMLDRVDTDFVERLLGDAFTCHVMGRTSLNEFQIEPVEAVGSSATSGLQTHEEPVDFVRVVVNDDMRVLHTVAGWPAAFWRPVGRGKVVFTTLGPHAWVQRRVQRVGPGMGGRGGATSTSAFMPKPELEELPVMEPRTPSPSEEADFEEYLMNKVGYRIASRTTVVTLMSLFCGGLIAAAFVLHRGQRLDRMAWVAPAFAIAATLPLILFGMQSKSTPSTIVEAQMIEVSHGGEQFAASGRIAFYEPTTKEVSIGADSGGVFDLDDASAARRMVWTDTGTWRWENIEVRSGIQFAEFQRTARADEPIRVIGSFSEEGLVGRIEGVPGGLADALISLPGLPRAHMEIDGDQFVASETLGSDSYIGESLLDDEQRRRQIVFDKLFADHSDPLFPSATVLGWGQPFDMKFKYPADSLRDGSALYSIPLIIERAPPDQLVHIPAAFVQFHTTRGPTGAGVASLHNPRTGKWVRARSGSHIWLRCQLPRAVKRVELTSVKVSLRISAPSRLLQIAVPDGDDVKYVEEDSNPIGDLEFTIDDPALLDVDDGGSFLIGLIVSEIVDPQATEQEITWKMDHVHVEANGRTK